MDGWNMIRFLLGRLGLFSRAGIGEEFEAGFDLYIQIFNTNPSSQ